MALIRRCSWCQKIMGTDRNQCLGQFMITDGICEVCEAKLNEELDSELEEKVTEPCCY